MAKSKGIAGKIVASALALAIAAGGVSLLGYTSRDTNGNWFGGLHWADNNITADGGDVKNENGGAVVTEGESDGMLMLATAIPLNSYEEYGVSALAENAYSLSVTYTPSDTTFKQTSFTAAFKNPSSSWASGKSVSDYVSVTATGDTTATLTVLKPFSEQIIVTATCNRNTAIKATTTVDYVCTTLNINVTTGNINAEDDTALTCSGWSNGTVAPVDDSNIKFVYDAGASFVSAAQSAGFTVERYYSEKVFFIEGDFTSIDGDMNSIKSIYYSLGNYNSLSTTQQKNYRLFLGRYFANVEDGDDVGCYGFTYNRVYNGVDYGGVTIDNVKWSYYDRGVNYANAFPVEASSMSTNSPSIIAG